MMIYYLKSTLWLCVKEPETNPFVLELQKEETKKKEKKNAAWEQQQWR